MSLYILGGYAKSFQLKIGEREFLRPTAQILKRKVFDRYQDLSGYSFIDLCAGTGNVGCEALSRGADRVLFFEKSVNTFKLLESNLEKFQAKFPPSEYGYLIESHNMDALTSIDKIVRVQEGDKDVGKSQCIIYLDPPYEQTTILSDVIRLLKTVKFSGMLWLESDKLKGLKEEDLVSLIKGHDLEIKKCYNHSTSYIAVIDYSEI